jgi:hypothetical protein
MQVLESGARYRNKVRQVSPAPEIGSRWIVGGELLAKSTCETVID